VLTFVAGGSVFTVGGPVFELAGLVFAAVVDVCPPVLPAEEPQPQRTATASRQPQPASSRRANPAFEPDGGDLTGTRLAGA